MVSRLGVEMAKSIECFSSVSAHRPSGVAFFILKARRCGKIYELMRAGRYFSSEGSFVQPGALSREEWRSNIGQPVAHDARARNSHLCRGSSGERGWKLADEKDSCTRITTPGGDRLHLSGLW